MKILKIILIITTLSLFNVNAFGEEKKDCSQYSAGDIKSRLQKMGCKMDNATSGFGSKKTLAEFWKSKKTK